MRHFAKHNILNRLTVSLPLVDLLSSQTNVRKLSKYENFYTLHYWVAVANFFYFYAMKVGVSIVYCAIVYEQRAKNTERKGILTSTYFIVNVFCKFDGVFF